MKKYRRFQNTFRLRGISCLLLASALLLPLFHALGAQAATLTQVFVRFDRMTISTQTTGTVCAKQATAATDATVQVTFPTGYTLGAAATFTVSTTNLAWPSGASAWPGIGTASNVTGQVVTFPSTTLTPGTLYCFNWTNTSAVQIKSSATSSNSGSVATYTSTPTLIDSANFTTASISNDQIVVSATVNPSFSFALSGNTDALGTLTTGSVSSSPTPRTVTVNTNAKNGWTVWAKDANTGLASSNAGYTIASKTYNSGAPTTVTAGSEGYNTGVTSSQTGGTGTLTVDPGFLSGGSGQGGGLSTTLRALANSNGSATNAVLTLTNNVAIAATTPAAPDYTDTITVIGAGLF